MTVFSPRSPPYFYPRSPRGERQSALVPGLPLGIFLSTLPARGATAQKWVDKLTFGISIHAPREGSD